MAKRGLLFAKYEGCRCVIVPKRRMSGFVRSLRPRSYSLRDRMETKL